MGWSPGLGFSTIPSRPNAFEMANLEQNNTKKFKKTENSKEKQPLVREKKKTTCSCIIC